LQKVSPGPHRTRWGFAPDPTKGTFEKVPLEPPKLLGQGIMKRNGGAEKRQRELLKKFPLDSLKTFGAGDYVAEWWRALTEAV